MTCAETAAQNIEKCVQRCGLEVDAIVLEQLASSYSVITDDERDLGVCMVDIGGGTSDIAIFTEGSIRHTGVIPIAGDQVTSDIAMALRTPTRTQRKSKSDTLALAQLTGPDETIKVPSVGDRPPRDLSRQSLAEVVEPRYDELFTLIQGEIRRSGFEELIPAGVVLTGGTSKMEGVVELAEEIFHMPVRVGAPQYTRGMHDIIRNRFTQRLLGCCCRVQKNFMRCAACCGSSEGQQHAGWVAQLVWQQLLISGENRETGHFQTGRKTMFELVDNAPQNAVIKVIGVGGGGGNAVRHMIEHDIEGVDFICANTDSQALADIDSKTVLQLGNSITKGLGAGANPEIGRAALWRIVIVLPRHCTARYGICDRRHGRGTGTAEHRLSLKWRVTWVF